MNQGGGGTLAIVLAAVSLGIACLSLGWQVANYVLTGARVKVQLRRGFLVYDQPVPYISVEAMNVGRHAVEVQTMNLRLATGDEYVLARQEAYNPPLPKTLEAGHSLSLKFLAGDLLDHLRQTNQLGSDVRGRVILGTGREVLSEPLKVNW